MSEKKKGAFLIFSISLLVASAILVVLLLLSIFLLLALLGEQVKESRQPQNSKYLLTRYNPTTNKKTKGFVWIPSQNLQDDQISYESEGNHFLISRFESKQYRCYGTCVCEEEGRRTASLSLLGRVFCLIASTTTAGAIILAQNSFHEECASKYENTCSFWFLKPKVEDCDDDWDEKDEPPEDDSEKDSVEDVIRRIREEGLNPEAVEGLYLYDENNSVGRNFFCSGQCLERPIPNENNEKITVVKSEGFLDCSQYEISVNMYIRIPVDRIAKEWDFDDPIHYIPEMTFIRVHMNPFCSAPEKGLVHVDEWDDDWSVCAGVTKTGPEFFKKEFWPTEELNPTIKCVPGDESFVMERYVQKNTVL